MPSPDALQRLDLACPIFQAPIGGVASPELAAAISNAGGLGHLACTWRSPAELRELFATGNDVDNRAAVAGVPTDALDLVGLGLHAERKEVDKVIKGLALHP